MELEIVDLLEGMTKNTKCPIKQDMIPYIDPYSKDSKTSFKEDVMFKIFQWVSSLIEVVENDYYETLGEVFSLPKHLNILTTVQILIYYATHHRIEKNELPEVILASFITTQLIYNDYSDLSKKKVLTLMMKDMAPKNQKFLYDPNKILKQQMKMVKFFDYDFYHLAITANYLILLNKCLNIKEPTDDLEFIEMFEDSIEKNVFDRPENLSLRPFDLTKLLIKDIMK